MLPDCPSWNFSLGVFAPLPPLACQEFDLEIVSSAGLNRQSILLPCSVCR